MLPPLPTSEHTPESERLIFRRLESDCPEDWTVIHSLGIARHERKRWAEADFVVITPLGILVIEVKGGQIRRRNNVWFSNDAELDEPPLDQATGAANAIRNELRGHGISRRAVIDGAALFPDVHFELDGADIERERIGDLKTLEGSLADWITTTLAHCRREAERMHTQLELPGLSGDEHARVVEFLAGDFELRASEANAIVTARNEMIRLTKEQEEALELAEDNPRALFDGGAGTGKTLLAVEHAMRNAQAGERVLLIVFNKALARQLRERTSGIDGLDVLHFHGLVDQLIDGSERGRPGEVEGEDFFRETLPLAAIEAFTEQPDPQLWDLLVVDESQDLLHESALDLFDLLLTGGLDAGRWCFFHDSAQDIFGAERPTALARLEAAHPARKLLRLNCRNTRQIAEATAACSARQPAPTLPLDGPAVEIIEFDEHADLARSAGRVLKRWITEDGIAPGEIVVLSYQRRERSALKDGMPPGVPAPLEEIAKDGEKQNPDAVRFSTIQSFKGLEADAVLLLNAGNPEKLQNRDLLYVGLSRARLLLAVGVSLRDLTHYEQLLTGTPSG